MDLCPIGLLIACLRRRGQMQANRRKIRASPGRVAQWESARLTRERSLVRTQPRPSRKHLRSLRIGERPQPDAESLELASDTGVAEGADLDLALGGVARLL